MYVSCGTYQYSGYINDGIYENSDDVYAENEENKPNKNIPIIIIATSGFVRLNNIFFVSFL